MPLDGLTLKVLTTELQQSLTNGRMIKIYQPNEFTLTFHLRLPGSTEILLLSADPLYPRLHTISSQPTNPLNPPAFCMLLRKHLEPSRLVKIEQQGWDRIVHFRFECLDDRGQLTEKTLILEIMGRHSNLFFIDEDGLILDVLKRYPERQIAPGFAYTAPSDQGKIAPLSLEKPAFLDEIRLLPPPTLLWKWILNTFQGFSKVAAQEVIVRAGLELQTKRSDLEFAQFETVYLVFQDLLEELAQGGKPMYYPARNDFAAYALTEASGEQFSSTNALVTSALSEKVEEKTIEQGASQLRRLLANDYKRLERKEAILENTISEAENAHLLRHEGELLTANFHLIPTGELAVQVPDYTLPGQPLVEIKLDPRLSPSANVQRIFKRYNKAKTSKKFAQVQLEKTQAERRYLEDVLLQIELADEQSILDAIKEELINLGLIKKNVKTTKAKPKASRGPERYRSVDDLTILVGRNNQQNDELTFRLSSPNHLWLHARNIPGSHVVILAEDVPESTLIQGALLAAYFSQSRSSPKVSVDYTLRRHVRKPKGAKPGFVHYDHAKTIVVNPTEFKLPPKI